MAKVPYSKAVLKDNSTGEKKISLRRAMLKDIESAAWAQGAAAASPVVMETHGGLGHLYKACYSNIRQGIVFERDPAKTLVLAAQRPTWAVYEADCVDALKEGAGNHLDVTVLDVDPYGDPWPTIEAFFGSKRPFAPSMHVVVNDGLRQEVRIGRAWAVNSLQEIVSERGNNLNPVYLEVCQELLKRKAALAGYSLDRFIGYYCGFGGQMTHYLARLQLS